MSTTTHQVGQTTTATLLVASGDGPHLIVNLDPATTIFIGDSQAIRATDPTGVIPLAPNGSIAVDGKSDKYAITSGGLTAEVAVVLGGLSTFRPLTSSGGSLLVPLFVYDQVNVTAQHPFGNLIASVSPTAGTDAFGFVYFQGVGTYSYVGNMPVSATRVLGGATNYFNWDGVNWGSVAGLTGVNAGILELQGASSTQVTGTPLESGNGTIANPTVITTDVAGGSAITAFANGWSAGTDPCRVTLLPDDTVLIEMDAKTGTLISGTQIASLPDSAYFPSKNARIAAGTTGGTASVNGPYLKILPIGAIQCFNMPTGATEAYINGVYNLQ